MSTPEPRTVRVALTRDDFLLANAALRQSTVGAWVMPVAVALAAALGFALVVGLTGWLGLDGGLQIPLAMVGAASLAWLASARFMRRSLTAALRNDGAFLRPFRLTATVEGLLIESDVARTELTWRGVLGVDVTSDQVLIRIDGASAVIAPLSAFADVAAMRAFGDHLRTLKREGGDVWAVAAPVKVAAASIEAAPVHARAQDGGQ